MNHRTAFAHFAKSPFLVSGILALVLCTSLSAESFIVKDGQPRAEIVVADRPARMARLAAEELRTYVEKITGGKLPIGTKPTDGIPIRIYVGKSSHTDRLKINDEGLRHGAFRMISGDNWLVLLGRDRDFTPPKPHLRGHSDWPRLLVEWDKATGAKWGFPHTQVHKQYSNQLKIWEQDERGSLNAVYEFLRMQGVRWYLPHELGEIVPKKAGIELPEVNKTVRPDFALRYPYQYLRRFAHANLGATRDEVLWQLRLGLNQAPDLIGMGPQGHGINLVHCRDEIKQNHPEYYALFGGKRATARGGKPCLSSEGLLRDNVKLVRALFDILDVPRVSVMPADGYVNLCQCERCEGKGTPERGWSGQISDYVWGYVDRVAREVYKTHPNKKVSCLAYGGYLLPPEQIDQLSPNVAVGIAQARREFYDPQKRKFFEQVRKGWLDKMPEGSKQLWIWEYYLSGRPGRSYEFMPIYFPRTIAQDLRSLKGISAGDFIEVYRAKGSISALAATHLNLYVTSRLWWDADQDVDALLADYYTNFYGPVRDEMKAFVEYSEANWMKLRKSPENIDRLFELLTRAERNAPGDSVFAKRVAWIADYVRPLKDLKEQLTRGRENVPSLRTITRAPKDIRMDGRLDDEFWQGLGSHGLRELQTGRPPVFGTSFKVAWAGQSMYFGITCRDRDTKTLNISSTKDGDMNIFNGDTIELLIETQAHSYYQIVISPSGAVIDLDREKGLNTLWSSGIETAAHIGDGSWSLEVRVPVAGDLQGEVDPLNGVAGRKPSETYPWYFNVCRQRMRDTGGEYSAFSPTGKKHFHDVMKFGRLFLK